MTALDTMCTLFPYRFHTRCWLVPGFSVREVHLERGSELTFSYAEGHHVTVADSVMLTLARETNVL